MSKKKPSKKSDNTQKKQKLEKKSPPKEFLWKAGQSGNPKGRPKGSRSVFAETFVKDFMEDWNEYGTQAIKKVREEDTTNYVRVAASLIPKDFNINLTNEADLEKFLEQFTDEELADFVAGVTALGASGKTNTVKTKSGAKSDAVH